MAQVRGASHCRCNQGAVAYGAHQIVQAAISLTANDSVTVSAKRIDILAEFESTVTTRATVI